MTKNKTKKIPKLNFIYITTLIITTLVITIIPSISIQTFLQGILLWGTKVLPALLPFFILTKLLSYTSFISNAGKLLSPFTYKLYGVGGISGYVYFMSIISGYPIGAKLTSDLYQNKQITSRQAKTISSFTSTSGPLFILGTVGIGFFNSSKLGIIVLVSHLLGALMNGLLYRNKEKELIDTNTNYQCILSSNPLSDSMYSSIVSITMVGGFIALFYMILNLMLYLNAFALPNFLFSQLGVDSNITTAILSGCVEVTTGLSMLSKTNISFNLATIISSFLISFGGVSIHAQAYCYLRSFNLKYSHFLLQKVTHAIIAASVTSLMVLLI